MAVAIVPARDPKTKQAYLQIVPQPAVMSVVDLLRSLKQEFKEEWRAVHYEIASPKPSLIVPEGTQPTSEGADHAADESGIIGTPNEDPIGIGEAVASE